LPHTKSAQKRVREAARRRVRNRAVRSQTKTRVTRAEKLVLSAETESAPVAVLEAVRGLDKAAEKGIIHRNNAARRKSRLMKKFNQAQASAAKAAEKEETKTSK